MIEAILSRLFLLSVGPRAKWSVVVLWLIPVVTLANFSIKFNNVQSDNPALFTPSGAESTQATAILQSQFPGGRLAQAIVVYQRPGGLTAADQARMRADMASFHGSGLPPRVQPPTADAPAANGTLASFSMAMQDSDATKAQRAIDTIRARVEHGGDGLTIRVTGPAAFLVEMLRGLAATGGIITSAGLILAGTFSVLTVLPLKQLVEIGFAVAFGILLDTVVVRSILVPALVFLVGPRSWWPSSLARSGGRDQPTPTRQDTVA